MCEKATLVRFNFSRLLLRATMRPSLTQSRFLGSCVPFIHYSICRWTSSETQGQLVGRKIKSKRAGKNSTSKKVELFPACFDTLSSAPLTAPGSPRMAGGGQCNNSTNNCLRGLSTNGHHRLLNNFEEDYASPVSAGDKYCMVKRGWYGRVNKDIITNNIEYTCS